MILRAGATKIMVKDERGYNYWDGCLRTPHGRIVWQCGHDGPKRHFDRGMALRCSRKLVTTIAGHALELPA